MQFWNELEGRVVEGYPLRRLARSEGRTAWFDTETHEGGVRAATISLTESLTDADEVTERLEAARRLKNPNLVAIEKIGRTRIDGTLFVYAIMEHTDQDLSDVLRGRALSKEEASQVAEALIGALTAIHREGWVHGRVEPANVLAVGEAVKLRSDCLQTPGGARTGDVAGIGAILFQAFTQRKASSADDAQINRIPAPFAEIVRNSLSSRWNLSQILAALKPLALPTASGRKAGVPGFSASIPAPAAASIAPPGIAPRQSPVAPPPASPSAVVQPAPVWRDQEGEGSTAKRPLGVYTVVALALLVLLGWLLFRPKAHPPSRTTSTGISHHSATPVHNAPADKPSAAHTAPTQSPLTGEIRAQVQANHSAWRVIVYTYRRQDQAQQKANDINHSHPDLAASVFAPKGGREPYLVVLGGSLDRGQAFKMRDKALKTGLPLDTYVQIFSK